MSGEHEQVWRDNTLSPSASKFASSEILLSIEIDPAFSKMRQHQTKARAQFNPFDAYTAVVPLSRSDCLGSWQIPVMHLSMIRIGKCKYFEVHATAGYDRVTNVGQA